MDPIYYIYHKLYHIFGDHVGHCRQACLRARVRAHSGAVSPFFFPSVVYCKSKLVGGGRFTGQRLCTFVHVNCTDAEEKWQKMPIVGGELQVGVAASGTVLTPALAQALVVFFHPAAAVNYSNGRLGWKEQPL